MSRPDSKPDPFNMSGVSSNLPGTGLVEGLSTEERAKMVASIQAKMNSIAGLSSGYIESLPAKVQARISVLKEYQSEHDQLEEKFLKERAELEAKYEALYAPLYEKRKDVVSGAVDAPQGEEKASEKETAEEEDVKGVPEFWLTAMKNSMLLQETISERDEGPLKFLTNITAENLTDRKGFKIVFHFAENSWFSNPVLTKTYLMVDDEDPIMEKAVGTEIKWNAGKNLTQKILKKKPKKGANKNAKPVTKIESCESFFNFFSPPEVPDDDEEIEEEEAEQLQDLMEADYEIGSMVKDKLIPHAVNWFTGEAADEEAYDEEEEEEDDEDEEGGEEEDDDDEDEEEVKPKGSKGSHGKGGKEKNLTPKGFPALGAPGTEEDQPKECKQQ